MTTISVVIPSIPPRARLRARALVSVCGQTRQPDEIVVEIDHEGAGAAHTRDKALRTATSDRVAFLDDDDELGQLHLERLEAVMDETGADLVFPWFTVIGGVDPFPQHFGRVWTKDDPTQTTITFLVKREAALAVGGFIDGDEGVDGDGHRAGEDFRFVCRLADAGYSIVHLPERTWKWHHHMAPDGKSIGNTSGRPWRELAKA